jgi:uncharacterized protein YegL
MSDARDKRNGSVEADGVLHVAFVLDRSGSMKAIEEAVVEGYNDYLGELHAQGGTTHYSLTTFNTSFEHVCVGEPLDEVAPLDHGQYRPEGMTALYDAIAHTVLETDRRLQADARGEEKVLVVVLTDGLENSSTDYDAHEIAELVRSYDVRENWTFVYLGAGHESIQDTRHVATRLGYRDTNAMLWSADELSTRKTMQSLAQATAVRRASPSLKSERFFADAGQSTTDYREDEGSKPANSPSPPRRRPAKKRGTIHRRALGDALASQQRPSRPRQRPE